MKGKVLVVEDSAVQAEVLRRLLTKEGYEAVVARDGVEGLRMARTEKPSLIVSDISMPIMDGYEMCRRMRDDDTLKNIPTILLTQLTDISAIALGLDSGADAYITKPYSEKYLLSKIESVLKGSEVNKLLESAVERVGKYRLVTFLVSTYENALELNRKLMKAQEDLTTANEHLTAINMEIEKSNIRLSSLNSELVAAQSDLTRKNAVLEQLYAEVQRLAITDQLTGIYNRRGFFEIGSREIERARRYGHPLSAIMFDLDHFKKVNDTYGHAVGDQVLEEVASRCRLQLRHVDIFGRYGGEEFSVLMPETQLGDARSAAERLRQSIAQPIEVGQTTLTVTISLGVAGLKENTADLEDLLQYADRALYKAKESGRNIVCVDEG